ncbi:MAG: TlpA disulfide reductase family protein, partial [Bacteroidota bacterium]
MKNIIFSICLFSLLIGLFSCNAPIATTPELGNWNFEIQLRENVALKISGALSQADGTYQLAFDNGGEKIIMDEVTFNGDTLRAKFPVFLSFIEGTLISPTEWAGFFYDPSRGSDYKIAFRAKAGERSVVQPNAEATLAKVWEVAFSPDTEDTYPAIGKFEVTDDGQAKGTFMTETGDYRFLHGTFVDSQLTLQTLDGAHLFVFEAQVQSDGTLAGAFYSGNHWQEPWVATVNPDAALLHPDALTVLKEGYDSFTFSFPNVAGDTVTFPNDQYKGKAVVVQLLGSWCPNCMDETRLFTQWHQTYHNQGLEIIGLAFERSESTAGIARMKESIGIPYD